MKTFFIIIKKAKRINLKLFPVIILLLFFSFSASAQDTTVQTESSTILSNPVFIAMITIIMLLLILIIAFASVLKAAAPHWYREEKKKDSFTPVVKVLILLFSTGALSTSVFAQTISVPEVVEATISYWGLGPFTFYILLSVIILELLIVFMLYSISMEFLGEKKRLEKEAFKQVKVPAKKTSILEKINASVAIEKEAEIILDHDYDGIRELDNNLPPWWKYGFYLTIVWSVIYMVHYHVTNTGKLQLEEYEEQIVQGNFESEQFRKKSGNLIDENNASLLSDEASINSGKSIYTVNCSACHGQEGQGVVGPNLTDNYWIHKGGIKDIFKIIKYGIVEKGMKSWQQDLSPKQIQEVSSYILSLQGSNPPNAKDKQGELYLEEAVSDSTVTTMFDS